MRQVIDLQPAPLPDGRIVYVTEREALPMHLASAALQLLKLGAEFPGVVAAGGAVWLAWWLLKPEKPARRRR